MGEGEWGGEGVFTRKGHETSGMFRKSIPVIKRFMLRYVVWVMLGAVLGFAAVYASYQCLHATSTDAFCGICHVHPHVEYSWKKSTHYKNKSGTMVHCVECHLPPGGFSYLAEKTRLGVRDVYAYFFTDTRKIDWEEKSTLERAVTYIPESSCLRCHQDLYSLGLTPKGVKAHEYYLKNSGKVLCINCHLATGHWREKPPEMLEIAGAGETVKAPVYPSDSGKFESYTETIPGSDVAFNMIAMPGGEFIMGSPESEPCRRPDEGPASRVTVRPFWMEEIEVSWREYLAFYAATSTGVKTAGETQAGSGGDSRRSPDAITGPTPPYGAPDQGWGKGLRPAITMTYHAAETYCLWLTKVTGKKYRLPTEAEWEYACRAGTSTPYPFAGDPKKLTSASWRNRLFGVDDSIVRANAWFRGNSGWKTQPPYAKGPNAFGLYNMLGNVREFCLDWYAPDAYQRGAIGTSNYAEHNSWTPGEGAIESPSGPASGAEHVVRGGSYSSDPADLRSAARDHTYTDRWLMTDPQSPKSIWWYSDVKDVGFRVVREWENGKVTR